MRSIRPLAFAALLALPFAAAPRLAAQETPKPADASKEDREREERDERARRSDPLATPLAARISGKKSPNDFMIDVAWPEKPGLLATCRIYGDGVGLWNRIAQFHVDRKTVVSLMKTVRKERLGAFPAEVGESEGGEREIYGRIVVSVGDVTQTVSILGEGDEEFPELEAIAKAVMAAGRAPAAKGKKIANLSEGLKDLAAGTLAPEALEVLANLTADRGAPAAPSWTLLVSGRTVHARSGPRGQAPTSQRALTLSDKEYQQLVALLTKQGASTLPRNLWAPEQKRLRIQILNQTVAVEARKFAGGSREGQTEPSARFEKIWAWCEATFQKTQATGRPVAAAVPPAQKDEDEKEREKD